MGRVKTVSISITMGWKDAQVLRSAIDSAMNDVNAWDSQDYRRLIDIRDCLDAAIAEQSILESIIAEQGEQGELIEQSPPDDSSQNQSPAFSVRLGD